MNRRAAWPAVLALLGFSTALRAAMFEPKPGEVCDPKSLDLVPALVVLKLMDSEKITDRMIDVTGGPIDASMRARAVSDPQFCAATSGNHCAEKAKEALRAATVHLDTFIGLVLDGQSESFTLAPVDVVPGQTRVYEFAVGGHYQGKCLAIPKPSESASNKAPPSGFEIRSQVDDLRFGRDASAYKGLDPAKLGLTDDRASSTKKYSADIALGYRLQRLHFGQPGQRVDIVPFVENHQQRTESDPPPAKPGTNTLSAGIVFDVLAHWGTWQSLQFYPKYTDNRQDKSEVLSLNAHYAPEPGIAGMDNAKPVGEVISVMFEPSFNAAWSDVQKRGSNAAFVTANDFFRYGPEVNLRLFGYSGSPLEKFSLSAQYRYFFVSGGPSDTLKNAKASLSYSPITDSESSTTVSFTLSWVRGSDLDTLEHVHEIVLGVGLKY